MDRLSGGSIYQTALKVSFGVKGQVLGLSHSSNDWPGWMTSLQWNFRWSVKEYQVFGQRGLGWREYWPWLLFRVGNSCHWGMDGDFLNAAIWYHLQGIVFSLLFCVDLCLRSVYYGCHINWDTGWVRPAAVFSEARFFFCSVSLKLPDSGQHIYFTFVCGQSCRFVIFLYSYPCLFTDSCLQNKCGFIRFSLVIYISITRM